MRAILVPAVLALAILAIASPADASCHFCAAPDPARTILNSLLP